jgi:hypothetical protein
MKKILVLIFIIFSGIYFTSCEFLQLSESDKIFEDVNTYYKKINSSGFKEKLTKHLQGTLTIGDKQVSVSKMSEDILTETGSYLNHIAELSAAFGNENPSVNNGLKKSFSLYKKMVQEDMPKLVTEKSFSDNQIKMSEEDISKIMLDVKAKENQIVNELMKIEQTIKPAK